MIRAKLETPLLFRGVLFYCQFQTILDILIPWNLLVAPYLFSGINTDL